MDGILHVPLSISIFSTSVSVTLPRMRHSLAAPGSTAYRLPPEMGEERMPAPSKSSTSSPRAREPVSSHTDDATFTVPVPATENPAETPLSRFVAGNSIVAPSCSSMALFALRNVQSPLSELVAPVPVTRRVGMSHCAPRSCISAPPSRMTVGAIVMESIKGCIVETWPL